MKKNTGPNIWSRLLLWSHVISVVVFYLLLWIRTSPAKNSQVKALPPQPDDIVPDRSNPFISIILPARNEERNILRCVESLLAQDYDSYELIVVDDGSTDETGLILAELQATHAHRDRLSVLHLHEQLPQGWAGKPHALHTGIRQARGEWLLFTDADTWHMPNALRSSITQALSEQCDMFTMRSTQELASFWERTIMPMASLSVSMLYPPKLVNNPDSKVAIASGAYILIRDKVYTDLGGYARMELKGTLVDGIDLAYTVKSNGYKLCMMDGDGLVHVRMYQSFAEIWRGFRKNAYVGNRGGWPFVLCELLGLQTLFILPFLLPLYANLTHRQNSKRGVSTCEMNIASIVELTPLLVYRFWVNRRMSVSWFYAFTHPLAAAICGGILTQSMWRLVTGRGVDWRGRQYYNTREASSK